MTNPDLVPGIPGFSYRQLRAVEHLPRLTRAFDAFARERVPAERWEAFERYRKGEPLGPEAVSEVLVHLAPALSAFLGRLFGIEEALSQDAARVSREAPVFAFKRDFVKKRPLRRKAQELDALSREDRLALDRAARGLLDLVAQGPWEPQGERWDDELEVALAVLPLVRAEELFRKVLSRGGATASEDDHARARALAASLAAKPSLLAAVGPSCPGAVATEADAASLYAALLDVLDRWCHLRLRDPRFDPRWVSLKQPKTLDFQQLVPLKRSRPELPEAMTLAHHLRERDGFSLTDRRMAEREVLSEVDYCIYCHDRDKDSCSKGLHGKDGGVKANALGIPLAGCPLDEKISEAHYLKRDGDSLAALAVIMVDNPMLPGTGHRICNDCMKACIYQKQEPVNIPQIETSILTDVLGLRWGFEVYDLLTRWNPLRAGRPYALPYNGRNVLLVGLGPAGYTLAQYLLNEGFGVVGIDGLKVEPLPAHLVEGPLERARDHYVELDERVGLGFGGVSEYGITVRWDKNFLLALYLTLARRERFAVHGGVRFGGTMDLTDAWALGFHHVAIAAGAGRPTLVDIPNGLLRGIRQASDFLMALQLTGAYKRSSLANLSVRLPAVVIGGGLTAIDTATELRAYYIVQVEKLLARHEVLARELGEQVWRGYDPEELEVLKEALGHAREVREERDRARREGRTPRFNALLERFGGVTLAYRRTLHESPAYRLNHEEVEKALEEGVTFVERVSPREALADAHGAVRALVFDRMEVRDGKLVPTGELLELPARTVCVAAGTAPNVTYEREQPGTFAMDPKTRAFVQHRLERDEAGRTTLVRDPQGFFTSYLGPAGQTVSFYGDNHPVYAGSVVKAMASAKDGHAHVVRAFAPELGALDPGEQPARDEAWARFRASVDHELTARVTEVRRLTPTIVEVVVQAPLAARKFRPGQFYRLQNYESDAPVLEGTRLAMEGLALTGAWTDPARGLLSMIVLEMGASSRLCAVLRPGERVVVMGPTGAPTEIPRGENVVLCGGGLGNAVLFSIGKALKAHGCEVVYFAGYKNPGDLFHQEDIEASADQVVWSSDVGPMLTPRRPGDLAFVGNIVESLGAYARGELGPTRVKLEDCSRWIVIGSDRMMAAVGRARHGVLKRFTRKDHVALGSINSPMQCMMKEICAQCLQRLVDPKTGKASIVFTCFNQDQELDRVDFTFLNDRLRQASVQEKQSALWLERLLKLSDLRRA
ncbi:MAG: FAD-dependent oxidoreductase [Deltaproteobacteria bacterium]|nr:FAD-dependent oxidoreductase [Deltaproteobacteria bacterium]